MRAQELRNTMLGDSMYDNPEDTSSLTARSRYSKTRDTARSLGSSRSARPAVSARSQRSARPGKTSARSGLSARISARTTGRSSMASGMSARSGTSIGTINTEIRDMIRVTANEELKELRMALKAETEMRKAADAKIDALMGELKKLQAPPATGR